MDTFCSRHTAVLTHGRVVRGSGAGSMPLSYIPKPTIYVACIMIQHSQQSWTQVVFRVSFGHRIISTGPKALLISLSPTYYIFL
jgi:hypothetical protein